MSPFWAVAAMTALLTLVLPIPGLSFLQPAFRPAAASRSLRARADLETDHGAAASDHIAFKAAIAGSAVAIAALAAHKASRQGRAARSAKIRLGAARLHGAQSTRSPLVNWYCYEANIPINVVPPRPSPHPFGQVPHLSDEGGVEVFESGAILLYLADKYGGNNTPEARAKYTKWVVWANSTLEEVCFGHRMSGPQLSAPGRSMDVLEDLLSKSKWLVDDSFSVADVAVCSYLNYVPVFFGRVDLRRRPNVAAYMKRCAERPAFVKAFGQEHATGVLRLVEG